MDTTQKKSKNTQNAPQNDKLIHSLEDLKTQYPDLIDETTIDTFPGDKYHINVDTMIPPKRTAPRPVPIHQQAQFKAELNKMLKLGVIKPVTEATPWISSFVIVESKKDTPKQKTNDPHPKSKLRVCLDLSNLNKATTREPYYYRTIEDVIPELSNAKYFTIIDMK